MNIKKVILLFGNLWNLYDAQEANVDVTNIILKESINDKLDEKTFKLSNNTIIVNSIEEIDFYIDFLTKKEKFDAILSFTDRNQGVYLAHFYSHKYNVSDPAFLTPLESVEILQNKMMTRRHLHDNNLATIKSLSTLSYKDAKDFLESLNNQPIIIKPVDAEGSLGVEKINNINELENYFRRKKNDQPVMLEEFINGIEYSVEAISYKGNHKILGLTKKELIGENEFNHNPFVEKGHTFPAKIEQIHEDLIITYVTTFLDSLNVKSGITHSEVIFTKKGPILIESHLRPGGDLIPRLIELATDVKVFKSCYQVYVGNYKEVHFKYNKEASILYFVSKPGVIQAIDYNSDVEIAEELYKLNIKKNIGDKIDKITNTDDRNLGYLVTHSHSNSYKKAFDLSKQFQFILQD